ncbi:MAG TPA: type II secretion system protein [Candidatus Saccharimonadales bacterium]|nr:type II secretion system protein [Candidatus Saccharimonadales bacterium]
MLNIKPQRGFTIVELVITIVLFAILVPSIASFLSFLTDLNAQARNLAVVSATTENKVESLRSKGFVAVPLGTVDFSNELPPNLPKPRSATYAVSSVNPSLKQIDVTISYTNHGQPESYQYRTYLGELGVGQY